MGMGDAFMTTILRGFFLFFFFFFFNNKNNYQLPLPSWQGLGAWRTRLPKGSSSLFGRCRCWQRHPLLGGGCSIECPSPRNGVLLEARMGLKGGLFVLGP